nr:S16 family serine protease [Microbacterium endophyticum]
MFDEDVTIVPPARRRPSKRTVAGIWSLVVALALLLVLSFLPTSFVVQQPGPVYNTLGSVTDAEGDDVQLITVDGAETYPTSGTLDLLTVQVLGNRDRTPSWFELAMAWFDQSKAVVPIDSVFPEGQTTEERDAASTAMMVDSQSEAKAAALTELGYDVTSVVTVYAVQEGSAAEGVLSEGDVIVSADGESVADADALRAVIAAGEGAPLDLVVERDGAEQQMTVTPEETTSDGEKSWILGVSLLHDYDFPIDVSIELNNVGGPSAGMMFALGIIDTLTPDDLNGGKDVAGTGTISADGTVGAIGGIRQKLWGALDAGAEYFLAPETNCDEVVGHVPDGLQVFAVGTLDDALDVMTALSDGGDLDALPTCSTG